MGTLTFLGEVLRMAVQDISARPLRTVLTVAGFVISIGIAVILLAAGEGLQSTVTIVLRSLGEGQVMATPGRTTGVGGIRRSGREVRLRYDDVVAVKDDLPSFSHIAPFFYLRGGGAASHRYSIPYSPVRAVDRDYLEARNLPVVEGRWFSAREEEEGEWVTVLNEGLRRMIFRDEPAVGQWVEWRGRRMDVVGVVRDEANFPYILFIPYKTVRHMADARYISGLVARPRPAVDWDRAIGELRRVLAGLGGFDPADENALEIENNSEFTSRVSTLSAALYALVVTIAGVSLLLGGLGVANMMVIAVTERTREIGLRKALGATRRSIFLQILFESLIVLAMGGVVGISLGALACGAIRELPMSGTYTAGIEFNWIAALICLGGLGIVAVLASTIPARRAALLPAAEALRWE